MYKTVIILALGVALICTPAFSLESEPLESLTFTEFIGKVQAQYPQLKKQQDRVESTIASQHEAAAGFLPKFKGVSAWTTGDDPVYVFGTLLKQEAFSQGNFDISNLNSPNRRSNLSFGIEGQWALFDAFDTISRVRSAGQMARSEKLNEEFTQMEIRLLSIEAFYRAVLQKNLTKHAQEVFISSQKDLAEAESLNQKGMVLGADFYAAKVNGGMIERIKNRFERDSTSASILLNILMGDEPLKAIALNYEIIRTAQSSKGYKEWLETAYINRKDYESADAALSALEFESFRQKMSFLPKISAFGSLTDNTHDWEHTSGNYLLGIKGEMDFLDWTYGARTDQAALKVKEAFEEKKSLKNNIARTIAEENGLYETVIADLPVAERMVSDARSAMELTEKLYREGKKSVADLLEIRLAYLETAIKASETRFYAQTSYSRLLFLSGTLDQVSALKIAEGLKKNEQ